jgi:hypothetical protein
MECPPQKRRKNLFLKVYLKLNQEKIKPILDRPFLPQVWEAPSKGWVALRLSLNQQQPE